VALPLYEYKCVKCGHRFEKIESVSASETKKCPKCGAKAARQFAAPAIQFKGSGWYVTDYAGKGAAPQQPGAEKSAEKSGDGASPKPQEKPAATPPAESKKSTEKGTEKKKK
jgi:putative FmdB family regulatory protein